VNLGEEAFMKRLQRFSFGSGLLGRGGISILTVMFLISVLLGAPLFAQDYFNSDTFAGRVVFEGKPVAGADIYLGKSIYEGYDEPSTELTIVDRTDKDGSFSFPSPVGDPRATQVTVLSREKPDTRMDSSQ